MVHSRTSDRDARKRASDASTIGVSTALRQGGSNGEQTVPLEAAPALGEEGISAAVVNARFAKPLDTTRVLALARR